MATLRVEQHLACWFTIIVVFAIVAPIAQANPPYIHYSHNMRILKIPSSTLPGTVIYR